MAVFVHGLRLSDRYVLDRQIGSGGMSQVWLAEDEVLGRPVAIKAINKALAGDPVGLTTIRREARAAASISHPHVAQIYDYGEAEIAPAGPVPYLVMELLDGPDLGRRLADGPLPWPDAVRMAAEVAQALAAAHATGVFHRDVKPGNIVLTPTGARVVDFGMASRRPAHTGPAGADAAPTPRGGTPAYAAPEVLADEPVTPASDVYGLGAVLFAALTGEPPIAVTSWAQALQAHTDGVRPAPLAVAGLPAAVVDLCARCLAASPAARPTGAQVAAELCAALRPVVPRVLAQPAARPVALAPTLMAPRTATTAAPARMTTRAPALNSRAPGLTARAPGVSARATAVAARAAAVASRPVSVARAAGARLPRPPVPPSWRPPLAVAASALMVAGLLVIAVAAFGSNDGTGRTSLAPPPAAPAPVAEAPVAEVPAVVPATADSAAPIAAAPGRTDVFAALRTEISNARAAGTIDGRTADRLTGAVGQLRAGDRSLPHKVSALRRDLRSRDDLPETLVGRLDGLLRQAVRKG